jgi:Tfp pilus assembly protein PilN
MTTVNLAKQIKQRRAAEKRGEGGSALPRMALSFELETHEKVRLGIMIVGILSIFGGRFAVQKYTDGLNQERQAELTTIQGQVAAEKQKLASFDAIRKEIDSYESRMKEARDKLAIIERVRKNRNALVRMVDFVVSEMPNSVWLSKVSIDNSSGGSDGGTVRVEGYATSMQLVGDYLKHLEGAVFFPHWELEDTQNETLTSSAPKQAPPADAKRFEMNARIVNL